MEIEIIISVQDYKKHGYLNTVSTDKGMILVKNIRAVGMISVRNISTGGTISVRNISAGGVIFSKKQQ